MARTSAGAGYRRPAEPDRRDGIRGSCSAARNQRCRLLKKCSHRETGRQRTGCGSCSIPCALGPEHMNANEKKSGSCKRQRTHEKRSTLKRGRVYLGRTSDHHEDARDRCQNGRVEGLSMADRSKIPRTMLSGALCIRFPTSIPMPRFPAVAEASCVLHPSRKLCRQIPTTSTARHPPRAKPAYPIPEIFHTRATAHNTPLLTATTLLLTGSVLVA